ncbi:MAG: hypothetical protein AAF088_07465 [Pseudomonadota bacterium]
MTSAQEVRPPIARIGDQSNEFRVEFWGIFRNKDNRLCPPVLTLLERDLEGRYS